MGVRSKALAAHASVTGSPAAIYTVPAGETTLIKEIVATNPNPTYDFDLRLLVGGNSNDYLHWRVVIPAMQVATLKPWWALAAGTVVYAYNDAGGSTRYLAMYGAELEGAAD